MAFYNYKPLSSDVAQTAPSVWSLSRSRLQYLLRYKIPRSYNGLNVNGGSGSHVYNMSQRERDRVRVNDTGTTGTDRLVFSPDTSGLTAANLLKARFSLTMYSDDVGLEEITLASGSYAGIDFNGSALRSGVRVYAGNLFDTLVGSAYDDYLSGAGRSTLRGGRGDDTYALSGENDVVVENANEGNDTVRANSNYALGANVENLVLTGSLGLTGTGNSLINTITGNDGNNSLDGGFGADTLIGGLGDDTYYVDNAGDIVVEKPGEGSDTIYVSTSPAYSLSENVETAILVGLGVGLIGNPLSNTLRDSTLNGNSTISGGAGNDRIIGGSGIDRLTGGSGVDVFEFGVGDSLIGPGLNNFETITDFEAGVDIIDSEGDSVRPINVAWSQRRALATDFSANHFSEQFYRTESLAPGGVCAVVLNTASSPRTFLVIDSNNNGFDVYDNVVEITGYTGSLSNITVI